MPDRTIPKGQENERKHRTKGKEGGIIKDSGSDGEFDRKFGRIIWQ